MLKFSQHVAKAVSRSSSLDMLSRGWLLPLQTLIEKKRHLFSFALLITIF